MKEFATVKVAEISNTYGNTAFSRWESETELREAQSARHRDSLGQLAILQMLATLGWEPIATKIMKNPGNVWEVQLMFVVAREVPPSQGAGT